MFKIHFQSKVTELCKLTALTLILVTSLLFTACGSGSQETEKESTLSKETQSAKTVKAGFIFINDENSSYDFNFIESAKEACGAEGVDYLFKSNIPEGEACYTAAVELAEADCNMIFANSFGHEDYMIQAAKEYPEVHFFQVNGVKAHTEKLDNYHNIFASIYEGRYLSGIAAGMKINELIQEGAITEDQAKVGFVASFQFAECISNYTSFYLGARSVCPGLTMDVTFTGSWTDETGEREGANRLIDRGCQVIASHTDSPAVPVACEQRKVFHVGYSGSSLDICPTAFLVASRIYWEPLYLQLIQDVKAGNPIPTDFCRSMKDGSVELTEYGPSIAEGTKEAIEAAKEELLSGQLQVFSTDAFTVDGEKLTSYLADVDSDANFEHETEVIIDGVFQESNEAFRASPYFDLTIDGITLLNESN